MQTNNIELRVLVKGRPVTEYFHEAQYFIEGREGTDFELQVRNKSGNRVMAILSVDGLSITDGKPAGSESPGYVINAYQTITIPGWKLSGDQAAKFTFGSRSSSYVAQSEGDTSNSGVIGLMVWSEKKAQPVNSIWSSRLGGLGSPTPSPWDYRGTGDYLGSGIYSNSVLRSAVSKGGDNMTGTFGTLAGAVSNCGPAASASSATMDSNVSYGETQAMSTTVSMNNLGTEFGQATTFSTTSVNFDQDVVIDTLAMFYDDARGLKARGIVLTNSTQNRATNTPNPFPAMGCTPPKGWKG